ncbi:MAG: acyl-CoA dehydrogenase family protein [Candidatus Eremiobacteraeota bacterium]|nr:acyl-CoA dehydrogenase family protein [Candidatus Eremiobacteraeota bacterium]
MADTHVVENQPPPLEGYNVFTSDRALAEAYSRETRGAADAELIELGALAGSAESIALGFEANENPPELRTHDRFGHRIDEVAFHPAYHALMHRATAFGLHGTPWRDSAPYPHVRRAAKFYVWAHVEQGHGCPMSMTYAAVPALRIQPEIADHWESWFSARAYDPRLIPVTQKHGATCGMGMTEKQGGSDVRANSTRAMPASSHRGPGCEYVLTGHKWFCSAPMSDAFLVLAQTDAGVSCFFVPRVLPDGSRNSFAIQRLKHKLGNRSNASSEIELDATHGWLVGEEGRGVQTIVEMVNHTRLDCMLGSAAIVREALSQAIHHARYRRTFGSVLIDHALMRNVIADLALESEAAVALFMRVARAIDEGDGALKRIGTAIGKYYICKRAPGLVYEALECLGGNGYVEESILPRLYREAPVNSIWEGSGSIQALDVLRILRRQPESIEALRAEISHTFGDTRIATEADRVMRELALPAETLEARARWITERLALLWQAALLVAHAPPAVSDAFIESRLGSHAGRTLGTLPSGADLAAIVERASW